MNYTFARNALIAAVLACPIGAVAYFAVDDGPQAESASEASTATIEPGQALAFAEDSAETKQSSDDPTSPSSTSTSTTSSTTSTSTTSTSTSSTTTSPTTATVAPTTVAPTTAAPTTVAPTTAAPRSTVAPTTRAPTTLAPTTTAAPTTAAPRTTTTVAPTTTAAQASAQQRAAAISLTELNATRAQVGLAPLIIDPAMSTFATNWSTEMISSGFRHSSGPYGENIAWHSNGNMTPQQAAQHFNQAWVNSPGHYANMTNTRYTHVGIGLVQDSSGWWATHVFG